MFRFQIIKTFVQENLCKSGNKIKNLHTNRCQLLSVSTDTHNLNTNIISKKTYAENKRRLADERLFLRNAKLNPDSFGAEHNERFGYKDGNHLKHTRDSRFLEDDQVRHSFSENKYLRRRTHQSSARRRDRTVTVEDEEQFLVKAKQDPDTFGNCETEELLDEGDIEEEKHFTEQPSRGQVLRTKQYADMIKAFIRKRQIKEAIDVVEVRMLKEDRVKPVNYLYHLLLGGCGRVGYTKKAFKLFNDMKKRGLKVTGGAYTALFNACSNSPWPLTDGLTRAKHLRELMIEKQYEPNYMNYNAMIKAFGHCGDISTAFSLVDEMQAKGFKIQNDTMNFLLQACITDKEAGFRHALLVWRKMVDRKIAPDIYTYNLMLRAIRDCGLGDSEVAGDVINRILENLRVNHSETKFLCSGEELSELSTISETKQNDGCDVAERKISNKNSETVTIIRHDPQKVNTVNSIGRCTPNIMADVPHLGNLISLSEVSKPEDRFLLVGGCKEFLQNMENHNCTPDIKTFTQILEIIPSSEPAEHELLTFMKTVIGNPDLDFLNMLMKKKFMRKDYEGGKNVLKVMKKYKYRPNLFTYGILAISCQTLEEARELIGEMKTGSYRLNKEIVGTMLHTACSVSDVDYIVEVINTCIQEQVNPDELFIKDIEIFLKKQSQNFKKLKPCEKEEFILLRKRYKLFLKQVKLEDESVHPWQQFRQNVETDTKYFKPKDASARFKAHHLSLYRVKTSKKHLKKPKKRFRRR